QLLELLPFDGEDMEEYSRIMAENLEALGEASEGLEKLIHMLDMTPPSPAEVEEAIMSFRALEDYDRSIHLPYEYREASGHLDLAELLRRAQGFPAGIGELAPDVDKDLTWMYAGPESTREYTLEDLSLGEGFQAAYLRAEYATGFFRNFRETVAESNGEVPRNLRGDKKKKGTFDNQVEYLIVGSCNEFQNVNGTRQRLLGVRTLMNAAYLLSDPVKRQEIESLAAATGGILLPGVGDIIAFAAILSGWSLAESAEDYRILTEGGKIPLWKTDDTWQTDLESLLEDGSQGAGETSAEGLDYEAYLRILLYMTPRETTLCRIQEMLYLDHDEFPLEEAVTGFRVYGSASGISTLTFEGSYRFYEDRSPGEEHE
ncbi:MAG: hypothetical protein HUJ69_08550, partial [Lachnospiraceae bacterium]|nr:hypothetical protein [Lachnospiraceae bacterium]